jgi:hypothetical protein
MMARLHTYAASAAVLIMLANGSIGFAGMVESNLKCNREKESREVRTEESGAGAKAYEADLEGRRILSIRR